MRLAAVFLVSLSSLSFEVLLTRFFSISQWNSLSFMVLSIALFGFAASGSLKCLFPHFLATSSLDLYGLLLAGSFLAVNRLPLDYFRLPLEAVQGIYLLLTFMILSLPFFFAGSILIEAYNALPEASGKVYAVSMAGSAAGALLPALLLSFLDEGGLILASGLAIMILFLLHPSFPLRRKIPTALVAAGLVAAALLSGGRFQEIRPSPYKLLPQLQKMSGTRIEAGSSGLRGRLDRVESASLRFAPGLSLKNPYALDPQTALIRDADELTVLLRPASGSSFTRYSHSFAGYLLAPPAARVLILQQGGGLGILSALESGASRIVLAVGLPRLAREMRSRYQGEGIELLGDGGRTALAREKRRFDLIQVENWGASLPGMAGLNEEGLLTVEALRQALALLEPEGVLTISRRLYLPPSDSLKLYAAVLKALEDLGASEPDGHVVIIRSWDSYTLLARPQAFDPRALAKIRSFCRELNFDLIHAPGISAEEANRYHVMDRPYHFEEIHSLNLARREGRIEPYLRSYPLDIVPSTDDRPFQNRFARLSRLASLFRSLGSRLYTLFMSAEAVVLAVFAAALLLASVLLTVPFLFSLRPPLRFGLRPPQGSGLRLSAWRLLYFLLTGAGFMLIEMGFIQGYTLLFEDGAVAFTVVLGGLLIASAAGGLLSGRWRARGLTVGLGSLALLLALLPFLLHPALSRFRGLPGLWTGAAAVAFLLPFSLFLGIPFPTGLRLLARDLQGRALAWAANGAASVLASVVAVPLAMSFGISRVFAAGLVCYLGAGAVFLLKGKARLFPSGSRGSRPGIQL